MGVENRASKASLRAILGLGLLWVWGFTVFHSPALSITGGTSGQLNVCYLVSLAAAFIVALFVSLRNRGGHSALLKRSVLLACALMAGLATAVTPFFFSSGPLLVIAGVASGSGSASVALAWGVSCAAAGRVDSHRTILCAGLAAATVVAASHFLSPWIGYALAVFSLPASAILFPSTCADSPVLTRVRSVPLASIVKTLRWFLLSALAYGASLGCFRGVLFDGIGDNPQMGSILFFVGKMVAAMTLIALSAKRGKEFDAGLAYRFTLPVTVAALCLLALPAEDKEMLSSFLLGCGFTCFDLGAWILVSDVARRTRLPALRTFALMQCSVQGGMLLGAIMSLLAQGGIVSSSAVLIVVVVSLTAACAAMYGRPSVPALETTDTPSGETDLVEEFVERFGLTPREGDVLQLLLRGRSRDRIEKELVLSKSTVKTHVRHIYEKVGVKSQQELIDIAEAAGISAVSASENGNITP
ncbi:helix-turn-helix transcriptional regulator [Adlercreutzia wanghongyangiae]|uniref:helix-turn-helix transcriptional regulator n=1 Tax=Adlercreutzia wanghongyangiae TaxID=3111451 RepID=UPI002DB9F4C4|nr:helix-turn-helix transcriptional regulator [Adlercreutzia sp. R21]